METIKLLAFYWSVMLACYFIASRLRPHAARFAFLEKVLTCFIVLLVFFMGLQMGADPEVTSSLGTIGLQSVIITVLSVGGSILAVVSGRKIFRLDRYGMPKEVNYAEDCGTVSEITDSADKKEVDNRGELAMTLLILGFVALGMAGGYFIVPDLFGDNMTVFENTCGDLLVAGLSVLLGIIGFNMGLTGEMAKHLKGIGLSVIVIPCLAITGSLIGGAVYGMISSLTVREGIAISAGFGWYTLAPGLITEAGHTVAGAVSFMYNVMRETLGIIGIPLFARYIGYLECTAVPGVAAMDVCLPIVEKSTRQETMVYSFVTGFFMCLSVPVIVPLMIG